MLPVYYIIIHYIIIPYTPSHLAQECQYLVFWYYNVNLFYLIYTFVLYYLWVCACVISGPVLCYFYVVSMAMFTIWWAWFLVEQNLLLLLYHFIFLLHVHLHNQYSLQCLFGLHRYGVILSFGEFLVVQN